MYKRNVYHMSHVKRPKERKGEKIGEAVRYMPEIMPLVLCSACINVALKEGPEKIEDCTRK